MVWRGIATKTGDLKISREKRQKNIEKGAPQSEPTIRICCAASSFGVPKRT
jgi:hypothetical protein